MTSRLSPSAHLSAPPVESSGLGRLGWTDCSARAAGGAGRGLPQFSPKIESLPLPRHIDNSRGAPVLCCVQVGKLREELASWPDCSRAVGRGKPDHHGCVRHFVCVISWLKLRAKVRLYRAILGGSSILNPNNQVKNGLSSPSSSKSAEGATIQSCRRPIRHLPRSATVVCNTMG